jgi:MoaA/NifB/PqqE/SkfB family radical SAM enzyme
MDQFWRLTLDTNPEDCNASCIMCEEHSVHSTFIEELHQKTGTRRRRMPKDWLLPILSQAKEIGIQEIIPSTMGEPLIYPHFEYLLELCTTLGFRLNLTTNGTFPRRSVEDWAERIIPITTDVKFSWNGATAETYEKVMVGLKFETALENLKRFVSVRNRIASEGGNYCRVTLQLTFMTNNMHELNDLIRLASENGVDRIKGHHLWVHWEIMKPLSFKHSVESRREWNQLVNDAYETVRVCNHPLLLEGFYILPETLDESVEIPKDAVCPFLGKELWIAPDGRINPCCAPDTQRLDLGFFGRVPNNTLREAVETPEYQYLLVNYRNFPLCRNCNMRKPF